MKGAPRQFWGPDEAVVLIRQLDYTIIRNPLDVPKYVQDKAIIIFLVGSGNRTGVPCVPATLTSDNAIVFCANPS